MRFLSLLTAMLEEKEYQQIESVEYDYGEKRMATKREELGGLLGILVGFALLHFGTGTLQFLGLLLGVAAILYLIRYYSLLPASTDDVPVITDSPIARLLFSDRRTAPFWLFVRLYMAFEWLTAAQHKLGDPGWMQDGTALKGFWDRIVVVPETGKPAISFDWYRSFIQLMLDNQWYVWFAKLVAIGELLIGVCLLIGAFVGVAAFFGAFMNWNFLMAGSGSTNPLLFVLAIGLILSWKVAGYLGADRILLPLLGTPWSPGRIVKRS